MEKQNNSSREDKVSCKYKDTGSFVLSCEKEDTVQPAEIMPTENEQNDQPTVEQQTAPEQTATEKTVEDVDVPIVGDTNNVDESYVEPLGETASWYPDQPNYDNVVNYQYGKSSEFVASLTNPEEGITAGDITLIIIIVLSLMAIVATAMLLTGRIVTGHTVAKRKDFIKK